jgi:hypothetical protein
MGCAHALTLLIVDQGPSLIINKVRKDYVTTFCEVNYTANIKLMITVPTSDYLLCSSSS